MGQTLFHPELSLAACWFMLAQVLASILPGLRETRTSLSLGVAYVSWVVLVVTFMHPQIVSEPEISPELRNLVGEFGRPFVLSVAAFGVYLVGHLVLTVARLGSDQATRRAFHHPGSYRWFTRGTHDRLQKLVNAAPHESSAVISSVVRSSRTQLLRANKDLYERMQTRRYAALLRFGLAPAVPLVASGVMLHVSWSDPTERTVLAVSVLGGVFLWFEGIREFSISLAILVREVSAERIELELMKIKEFESDDDENPDGAC